MIVCHQKQFVFFHNPKCAGMSFRETLAQYHDDPTQFWGIFHAPYFKNHIDHSHLRLWELQAQYPALFDAARQYRSVIFVRNPYARFLSGVNEHMKKFQPHIDLAAMTPPQRVGVVEAFIEKAIHISRITTDWRFVHFSPQLWYLRLGDDVIPKHIIPIGANADFMTEALAILGLPGLEIHHINPSPVDLSAALQSKTVMDFVENFYSDDLAFLRSDARLAFLADSY